MRSAPLAMRPTATAIRIRLLVSVAHQSGRVPPQQQHNTQPNISTAPASPQQVAAVHDGTRGALAQMPSSNAAAATTPHPHNQSHVSSSLLPSVAGRQVGGCTAAKTVMTLQLSQPTQAKILYPLPAYLSCDVLHLLPVALLRHHHPQTYTHQVGRWAANVSLAHM
jgi:hypothetical protein